MFLERLKKLCAEKNIKITNLIKELKMSSGILSNWKRGDIPKANTLTKIADYFNVSTDYLLCKTDDPTPPNEKSSESNYESELDEYAVKLLKIVKQLSTEDIIYLTKQADFLHSQQRDE